MTSSCFLVRNRKSRISSCDVLLASLVQGHPLAIKCDVTSWSAFSTN